jgi:ferric iron reductase protein FhuF
LLGRNVIRTVVAPLVDAVRGVSARVLWGNVASAFGGAMVMLGTERATAIMESLLSKGILAGTGRLTSHGFVRNSCCLFYRIPDGGTCADCILNERS